MALLPKGFLGPPVGYKHRVWRFVCTACVVIGVASGQDAKTAEGVAFDPFSQPPVPPPVTQEEKRPKWTLPHILRLYEVDPEDRDEYLEAFNRLTPEDIERFRAEYLARIDPKASYSLGSILSATRLILQRIKQFDEAGIVYDRDILIETILEKLKNEYPLRITQNFRYLSGTRDRRIHDYVASFLNHDMELVREAAAKTLPTVDPEEGQPPEKVEVPQVAPDNDALTGGNVESERPRGGWWIVVAGGAALVLLVSAGIIRLRHRARR